jgi:hypothetical protein
LGNDIFFAYLPIVDNFWHSQGLFMATPRFPFYIAAWYVGWLYFSTVFVWHCTHFKASFLTHAAMVSLLSSLYYAPWDVVGARYIWWTWHTSDQMFNHRWFGVPYASTMFTLVFVFCWSMVLHVALFRGSSFGSRFGDGGEGDGEGKNNTGLRSPQDVSRWTFLQTTLSVSCLSVPLLLIVMPLLLERFKGCGGPGDLFESQDKSDNLKRFAFATIRGQKSEVLLVCNQYNYGARSDDPHRHLCQRTMQNSMGTSEGSVTLLLDFPRQPHGVRELAEMAERERQQQGSPKRQKK